MAFNGNETPHHKGFTAAFREVGRGKDGRDVTLYDLLDMLPYKPHELPPLTLHGRPPYHLNLGEIQERSTNDESGMFRNQPKEDH